MSDSIFQDLPGKKIQRIFLNEDYLQFVTDQGTFTYRVEGDCCSRSVFYDFVGVKKLLENGTVKAVKEIELNPTDIVEEKNEWGGTSVKDKKSEHDDIKVYGYAITTEHPEFGEMTSVFSFRNYSNGYYGGSMEATENREVLPEIADDVQETASPK